MSLQINTTPYRAWQQVHGDGVKTSFDFAFEIFEANNLEVYLNGVLQDETSYSVSGVGGNDGGQVTFSTAPAAGVVITLRRRLHIQRTTDFEERGAFRATEINHQLDFLTACAKQNADDIERSLVLDPTDPQASLSLPVVADRSGKLLGFDTEGNPVSEITSSDILNVTQNVTAAQFAADSIADMPDRTGAAGQALFVATDEAGYIHGEALRPDQTAALSTGYSLAALHDLGTISSGTLSIDPRLGALQKVTIAGDFTLAHEAAHKGLTVLEVTNDAVGDHSLLLDSGLTLIDGVYNAEAQARHYFLLIHGDFGISLTIQEFDTP